MDIEEAIYKRRTIRRFKQDPIPIEILKKLIDFARVAPAAINVQSIEYIIIHNLDMCEKLFPLVRWASLLPEKDRDPEIGRRPRAYIIILVNTNIKKSYFNFDIGASIENILLGAIKFGLGCCCMGSINGKKIRTLLEIPTHYEITHVISLGYPDEESIVEPYKNSFNYWKDANGIIHVPKRDLNDIIFNIY